MFKPAAYARRPVRVVIVFVCAAGALASGLADNAPAKSRTGEGAVTAFQRADTTGPSAVITAAPADPSASPNPTFAFTSVGGVSFQCALDGAALADCTSPDSYAGLADGSHTFQVQSIDALGILGPVVSYTWTVDTTPPDTKITSAPATRLPRRVRASRSPRRRQAPTSARSTAARSPPARAYRPMTASPSQAVHSRSS